MSERCPCGCGKPDECFPHCRAPRVRLVCPENGTVTRHEPSCPPALHLREEWALEGSRPKCDTHNAYLVTC